MKIKETLQIPNVIAYLAKYQSLAYNNRDNELFFKGVKIADTISYYFFEKYFCYNKDGKTIFVNVFTKEIIEIVISFNGLNYFNNTFLLSFDNKKEENYTWSSKIAIYQLFPIQKLYELPNRHMGSGIRFENYYIFIGIPTLKSLSLETGEYLWETNIAIEGDTDPQIREVLGISGDVMVVFTFGSTLVGIDVHTGKILWSILPKGFYPSGFTGMAWCWHLEDGYLYLLRHQYYLRINLSNQQLEILWQTPPDTLEFEDCSYTEDYVYFMAIDKKSNIFNTSILGVFDRKALQIVWQHDQPIYSAQPPQSDGNKLYCLDTGGTLHIFEKENLNP